MTRDPVKLIIGLGFTGVLTLMGLISFISLSHMNTISDQIRKISDETQVKISAANTMRDSIRLRGDVLHKMFLTDDYSERDQYRLELAEHALRYQTARDTLSASPLSAREARLLNQLIEQTRITRELNDATADNMLSDMAEGTIKSNLYLANEERYKMLKGLNHLVSLQEEISQNKIEDTKKYQEKIRSIIYILSLAAFFIALYIAQRVIRETTRKNSEIRYQATHDELTGLVNRKEFNRRLKEAFAVTREQNETHALCFLDLDRFKSVNDNCGHKAGDELLNRLTTVIKKHIRSHDTLGRIGGDEFGLLLEGCSLDNAIEIAEGLVSLIKNYEFIWHDTTYHVGVSIGLVMLNNETESTEKALSHADMACYAAKDMGRNQVQVHGLRSNHVNKMQKELSWVADINNADTNNRFSLHLQKINNVNDDQPSFMYEVLLRLNDDKGTLVSPGDYIPAAERFRLMGDVDNWVIKQVFTKLSLLYRSIPQCNIQLFINISLNSLNNEDFSSFVIRLHREHNIPPNTVCFEISEEQAIKNINQTTEVIAALRKHNIKFALDDFGADTASFIYLKNLSVDYLKIDGNLVRNIPHNTVDRAIVAAIEQIGRVMNIKTVAKHVEDVFTLNQLREMGIDYAQGFYLDKPEPINERIDNIKSNPEVYPARL